MPSLESWEAFAGVSAVVIFLGSLVFGLQRLGIIGQKKAAPAPFGDKTCSPAHILAELQRTQGELAALSIRVGELEVRMPQPEAFGRVHKRLDDLNSSVSHVEGELKPINRQLHLINDHLLNK